MNEEEDDQSYTQDVAEMEPEENRAETPELTENKSPQYFNRQSFGGPPNEMVEENEENEEKVETKEEVRLSQSHSQKEL